MNSSNRPVTVPAPARWMARTTLTAGVLALATIPFGALAVANATYKESDFSSCLERDMPTDYCCEHAGGVMRNGACINPDDLLQHSVRPSQVVGVFEPVQPTKVPPRVVTDVPVLTVAR